MLEIWTDGACRGNPGPGGWGAVLSWKGKEKELHGGEAETTNNRMELTAVIRALEAVKRPVPILVHLDSEYVRNGITTWIHGWKRKGWRKGGGPIKNLDLWQKLDALASSYQIEWRRVAGHSGDPGNERADELANLGCDEVAPWSRKYAWPGRAARPQADREKQP